jgi:hypothetical protein
LAASKKYAPAQEYEKKLSKVMERLNIKDFDWNLDRHGGWVKFSYKGTWYIFEHTVEKAREAGENLTFGSDAFAQIILTLEDLARAAERKIYDFSDFLKSEKFKLLPPVVEIPSFLRYMGFNEIPKSAEEVKQKYREMSKLMHPDAGGNAEDFQKLNEAYDKALAYVGEKQ